MIPNSEQKFEMSPKVCTRCGIKKSSDHYIQYRRGRYTRWCNECHIEDDRTFAPGKELKCYNCLETKPFSHFVLRMPTKRAFIFCNECRLGYAIANGFVNVIEKYTITPKTKVKKCFGKQCTKWDGSRQIKPYSEFEYNENTKQYSRICKTCIAKHHRRAKTASKYKCFVCRKLKLPEEYTVSFGIVRTVCKDCTRRYAMQVRICKFCQIEKPFQEFKYSEKGIRTNTCLLCYESQSVKVTPQL